jgi:hypothetical protein
VHQIADAVNRDATPPTRGLALLELLLADGSSPLYAGGEELGVRLQEIASDIGLGSGGA